MGPASIVRWRSTSTHNLDEQRDSEQKSQEMGMMVNIKEAIKIQLVKELSIIDQGHICFILLPAYFFVFSIWLNMDYRCIKL